MSIFIDSERSKKEDENDDRMKSITFSPLNTQNVSLVVQTCFITGRKERFDNQLITTNHDTHHD